MTACDVTEWHDLLVAGAGAAAALAGLVFVAVSINIERILQHGSCRSGRCRRSSCCWLRSWRACAG